MAMVDLLFYLGLKVKKECQSSYKIRQMINKQLIDR